MPIWGCDSINFSHRRPPGYPSPPRAPVGDRPTLYEYVVRRRGSAGPPRFWGRYINDFAPDATDARHRARAAVRLTSEEVSYLHDRDCRIAVVYNGIDPRYDNLMSYEAGRSKAQEACRIAGALNVPGSVRIYADLEGWEVGERWIRGWFNAMEHSDYVGWGGIYGRVPGAAERAFLARQHPDRDYWRRSLEEATAPVSAETEELLRRAVEPGPPPSGHRPDTTHWEAVNQAIAGPPARINQSLHVWSNIPRVGCNPNRTNFDPERAAGQGVSTVIHQYGMGCWRTNEADQNTGLIDMDVATDEGFQGMWA